jgi:hypothetical protein
MYKNKSVLENLNDSIEHNIEQSSINVIMKSILALEHSIMF